MEIHELHNIIQEIRSGRQEDSSVDWKRRFWDLSQPKGRREFLKDVTAMANSAHLSHVRRIIIGVSATQLHPCEFPEDEAKLQQRLRAITPLPTVHFERHLIETIPILVLEIRAPFDRPYVARSEDQHFVWIRRGSSTGTATRYELDSFYSPNEPKPQLSLEWVDEEENPLPVLELAPSSEVDRQVVLQQLAADRPSDSDLRLLSQQADALQSAIRRYGTEALGLGGNGKAQDLVRLPHRLAAEIDAKSTAIKSDSRELRFRYEMVKRAEPLRVAVRNDGTSPADGIVVYLNGNERLRLLSTITLHEQALPISRRFTSKALLVLKIAKALAEDPGAFAHLETAGLFGRLGPEPDLDFQLPPIHSAIPPPFEFAYEGARLRIDVRDPLKHNFHWSLDRGREYTLDFLIGDLAPEKEVDLEYSIHADNLESPELNSLLVRGAS